MEFNPAQILPSGYPHADTIIHSVIHSLHHTLPHQLGSVYIVGSYAEGCAVEESDLDLTVILRGRATSAQKQQAARASLPSKSFPVKVDMLVCDEAEVLACIDPILKFDSRLVWGEDLRDRAPLMTLHDWAGERMQKAYRRMMQDLRNGSGSDQPLTYPDAQDLYYGYLQRSAASGQLTTRPVLRTVGACAAALLSARGGEYAARRCDCPGLFRQKFGEPFGSLVTDWFEWGKNRWQYRVPSDEAGKVRLKELCRLTLGLEQFFLQIYAEEMNITGSILLQNFG